MVECFDEKILKTLDLKTIIYRTTSGNKTYTVDLDKVFSIYFLKYLLLF